MVTLNINYDDFNTYLYDGLQSILASSEMSDVTLEAEGKHFKAHRVILAIFSTYFRELFLVTPSRNTFSMKNVKHRIMHNLLSFMYEGKVQIPSEDFQLFVATANELKIKGLTNDSDSKAAEDSREQMNNAPNIEHIDDAPSLKRTSERMQQNAKKCKPSNNDPEQSTSEASDLTLETNDNRRETEDSNLYRIQLKEEDTDTVDVDSTEMYGFDDEINELDDHDDNTINCKESVLPLATSQINYPVIGEMEESNIDEIQPSEEDTEEKMDLVDIGPTEIHGLDYETKKLDGAKESNTMTRGNDFLVITNRNPLPLPSEGIPVTVSLCLSWTTKRVKGVIWDDFLYYFKYECKVFGQWRCTGHGPHKCNAKLLWTVEDGLITLSQSHNHEPCRISNQVAIYLESHTLYSVSNEYFFQHVNKLNKHKEEDTDVPTDMCGLDDKTNELAGHKDNTITPKESVLSIASSQIDHPVIGDMEVSEIDEIQPGKEDTERNMDLVDIGSTETYDLDDETINIDGSKEDNNMAMGNVSLAAIDCNPLPPSAIGIPVTVSLCLSRTTNKVKGLIWDEFRYTLMAQNLIYTTLWGRCSVTWEYKCDAKLLWAVGDGLITLSGSHTHGKRKCRLHHRSTDLVARTLFAVSNELFFQHVNKYNIDKTITLDGDKEDNTIAMGNDFLVATNNQQPLPPPPPQRKPVTVSLCLSPTTKQVNVVIWDDFRYSLKDDCDLFARWRCTASRKCDALLLWAVEDDLIALTQSHNHGNQYRHPQSSTDVSRTLYAVSYEYFKQHLNKQKEDDTDVPTEMCGFDDKTNKLAAYKDNTITTKESVLPLSSSQMDHPVIGDMEESDIGYETIQMDGDDENNTMAMGNDFLAAVDRNPLPPPSEGKLVTVLLYLSQTTKKVQGVIWDDFRYTFKRQSKLYVRFICTVRRKCRATLLCAMERGLITDLSYSHNHGKRRMQRRSSTQLISRTFYAVPNEYFFQHVTESDVPTEMRGLDDQTNELAGHEDNTITSKESVLPLTSSQVDHPVIGEMEVSEIDEIQPDKEDTEGNMNLVDTGPTEIYDLDDETIKLDGNKEDNNLTMGNDSLSVIDHVPLPPSSAIIPVTISLCRSRTTNKLKGVIWGNFRYTFRAEGELYSQWVCTANAPLKCKAKILWAMADGLITLSQSHSHEPRRICNHVEIYIEDRIVNAASNQYFFQRVGKHKEGNTYTIHVPTEMCGLDDKSNELTPCEDNTSSQIDHPVIGEMEVSEIDKIHPGKEATEANMDLVNIGPTEIYDLDDETINVDGNKEDSNMAMGNDSLVAIDRDPLPPSSEVMPVTISLCMSRTTNSLKGVIWGNFRYSFLSKSELYNQWFCTARYPHKCEARIYLAMEYGLITLTKGHNHEPRRIFNNVEIYLVSHTLNAASNEYFFPHVHNLYYHKEKRKHTMDVVPTEKSGLDDTTNELDCDVDNTITSIESVLPLASGQIDHSEIGEMQPFDINEIQHSEEDAEEKMVLVDVGPTEIHGLVDGTIAFGNGEDANMRIKSETIKEVSSGHESLEQPAKEKHANSQIDHPVIGEIEEFGIDRIQPSIFSTEENVDLFDIGPTEMHSSDDETTTLNGDDEDNNMTEGNDEDENDFLAVPDHEFVPPSQGTAVTVSICKHETTKQVVGIIWDDFRYTFPPEIPDAVRLHCTGRGTFQCKARLRWAVKDRLITLVGSHNHEKRRLQMRPSTKVESRTLYVVSNEYFHQHVKERSEKAIDVHPSYEGKPRRVKVMVCRSGTTKKVKSVIWNHFRYTFRPDYKAEARWACAGKTKFKCKARLHWVEKDNLIALSQSHNHPSKLRKEQRRSKSVVECRTLYAVSKEYFFQHVKKHKEKNTDTVDSPSEGTPVTITICRSERTKKITDVIWDDFQYTPVHAFKLYGRLPCNGMSSHKCEAKLLWSVEDGWITLSQSHNHEPLCFNNATIILECRNLRAVSKEYFLQHVTQKEEDTDETNELDPVTGEMEEIHNDAIQPGKEDSEENMDLVGVGPTEMHGLVDPSAGIPVTVSLLMTRDTKKLTGMIWNNFRFTRRYERKLHVGWCCAAAINEYRCKAKLLWTQEGDFITLTRSHNHGSLRILLAPELSVESRTLNFIPYVNFLHHIRERNEKADTIDVHPSFEETPTPVTVSVCRIDTTKKAQSVIWNYFRYTFRPDRTADATWACSGKNKFGCKARLHWAEKDGLIALSQSHNHEPSTHYKEQRGLTYADESLNAVSEEYFFQHVKVSYVYKEEDTETVDPPSEATPVTVSLCMTRDTKKLTGVIWSNFRYTSRYERKLSSVWCCAAFSSEYRCRAKLLWAREGDLISLTACHNHEPLRIVINPDLSLESRTLNFISCENFKQRFMAKR